MGTRPAIRLAATAAALVVAGLITLWWAKRPDGRATVTTAQHDEVLPAVKDAPAEIAEAAAPRLVVRAVDAETGAPLPGCAISARAWGLEPFVATTGDAGEVGIERLSGDVRAERRGYVPASARVSLGMSLLVLELGPAAVVRGRVVRAGSGEPIEGAAVEVTDIDESEMLAELITDREGRFEIPGVPPDRPYLVVARRLGLAPAAVLESRAQPDREIVLQLGGGAVLEGRVLRQDGTPVPRANVSALAQGGEPLLGQEPDLGDYEAEAVADAEGKFRIDGLRTPAVYLAFAVDDQDAEGRVEDVERGADGDHAWRDIRLLSRTTLVVDAVFPPGELPANPSINLLGHGAMAFNHATFVLKDGGPHEIVVYAPNWPETRLQADVREGARNEVRVLMSRDGHTVLSGRVRTETGVPLGGVGTSLDILFTTPDASCHTQPAADGTFHLCDVPASAGRLEVRDDNGLFATWIREGVAPGGRPVDVVLRARARLVGRVEPVPRSRLVVLHREYWSVTFDHAGSMVGPLPVEPDGSFAIPCGTGRPFRFAIEHPDAAPVFLREPPFAEGETRNVGLLRFGPGLTAEARVLDEIGKGIAGAVIVVDVTDLYGYRHVRTDASGRFRLDRLGESALELQVSAPGFVTLELEFPKAGDLHLQEIAMQPAGFVEGTVTEADGSPVPGADVECTTPYGDTTFQGKTDSLGRFRVAAAPGTYRLACGEEGPSVQIRARETTRVDFRRS